MHCASRLAGDSKNVHFVGFPTPPIQNGTDPPKDSCKNTLFLE